MSRQRGNAKFPLVFYLKPRNEMFYKRFEERSWSGGQTEKLVIWPLFFGQMIRPGTCDMFFGQIVLCVAKRPKMHMLSLFRTWRNSN